MKLKISLLLELNSKFPTSIPHLFIWTFLVGFKISNKVWPSDGVKTLYDYNLENIFLFVGRFPSK